MSAIRKNSIAALVALALTVPLKAETPDISTFMQIGASSLAGVNWEDGKMYFVSSMSGKQQVYRYMGDDEWPWQLSVFNEGIDDFTLSESGQWGVIRASIGGSEQGQLFLMNMANGVIDTLTSAVLDTIQVPITEEKDGKVDTVGYDTKIKPRKIQYGTVVWSPDDKFIYYRTDVNSPGNYQIYRMNIETRETEMIFDSPAYDAPAGVSADGSKLFVYSFQGNLDNDLHLIDLNTLESQMINDDGGEAFNYFYPYLMKDGKTIYLLSNNNKTGLLRLGTMTLGSPDIQYVSGWVDPKWSVDNLGFSRDYKYIFILVNEEGYARLKIRELESGKDIDSPPLDGMIGYPEFDESDNIYFTFSGPTYAPDVWRYNLISKDLEKLTKTMYAGVDRNTFSDPTLVKFKSFDGLEIPAFLYLPPNYKKGTPIPFLISAHGGPESQARPIFARNFQYFALNGYGILRVNPRGSSGYGKEFVSLDDYKNRKNSLKDYKAAVEWLIKNKYTEKGKIGIYGGSYGGYVTLGMITEYPDLFNAAIDIVGIANFVTFLERTAPSRRAVREAEYGPLSDRPFLESISPLNKADQIRTPLLVVHGENDPRVPVEEARLILAAVANNGVPVDSLIFPDEGHGASKRVNIIRQYRRMAEFFDTYLKGIKVEGRKE